MCRICANKAKKQTKNALNIFPENKKILRRKERECRRRVNKERKRKESLIKHPKVICIEKSNKCDSNTFTQK